MGNLLNRFVLSSLAIAALLITGCSQSATPANDVQAAATNPSGPPALVSAKTAFGPMYKSALAWSPDIQFITLAPQDLPGFTNAAGKAAMWEATFASPSKHQYRVYSYSIATVQPEIHKGTSANFAEPWAGASRDAMPIDLSFFTVDSDAAYQAASTEGAAWLAKNPGKNLSSLQLASTYRFQAPVWYISWGDKKNGYVAFVDATSGKIYKSK
jgi:hypothetical protein